MTNRMQYLISASLVASAVAVVTVVTAIRPEADTDAAGHDHVATAAGAGDASPVTLDPESARRIGVTFATAEVGPLTRTVRTVGTVTFDETRVVTVNPKIEGWVERLYVNTTGAPVHRGQSLMAVYSPMLVAAQEELVLAARMARVTSAGTAETNARELLDAARRRLGYWDLSSDEIARIERSGVAQRTVNIRAPKDGVVVEKNVLEGGRIMPGMDLYRIADMRTVWVEGEVFEKDLGMVAAGRSVRITFESYAGEVFPGRVTYVYPTVSQDTRTGRIRIKLANPAMRLKPGMFANVEFDVSLHIAGLHVPRTAVLSTGTRAVVFVRLGDGTLAAREVRIGQAAGDHVEILAGLKEGDTVVESASFLVDAEANLGAAMRGMAPLPKDTSGAATLGTPPDHTGH